MGNQTTVKSLSIGGALATLIVWVAGYYQPGLMETLPVGGEAAIAVVITGVFTWIKK